MVKLSGRVSRGAVVLAAALLQSIATAQDATPAALDTALQTATPGSIVDLQGASGSIYLNQNPNQIPMVPGTLIYSDDPETVLAHGILYRTPVPAGGTRVYIYHVNGLGTASKITAVLENAGSSPASVVFSHKALPTPSGNYVAIGKTAVQQWYENSAVPAPLTIPAGGAVLLDPALDAVSVTINQLQHGIYDFTSDQPLTVTVLMLPTGTNTVAANQTATVAAGDTRNRQGTMTMWGKENAVPYTYSTSLNIRPIAIGDGSASSDPRVPGFDYERQVSTSLPGNFGVTYKIKVNVSTSNSKRVALLLKPRGGAHGGYLRTTFAGGATAGQLVPSPTPNLSDGTKAIVCAKITPTSTPQLLTIDYMPPGASSLPVDFLLVPYSAPADVVSWGVY